MKLKLLFSILLLLGTIALSVGQSTIEIKGKVIGKQSNLALNGATVSIKGKARGTITNYEGQFVLQVEAENIEEKILRISFLGFVTQEISIGTQRNFTIYLEEDVDTLDEVVLTSSYGTRKRKEELVGSISSLKAADVVVEQAVTSFDQLLEGQVAGLYIESNPRIGEEVSINIRGQGSLTPLGQNVVGTSTQPLIIVDGIILSEEIGIDGNNFFDVGTGNLSENILNPLARVGIQDIEGFEVLKDAAAVGIYGADAANGVILITTKTGKKGKPVFTAQAQGGFQNPINQFQFLNGEQYRTILNI